MNPQVHRLTQVSSTLDVTHEYAARGAPHGTVVVAQEQLAGRGSRGRTWHSPPGGLWYSILLRGVTADEALSLRVGLAVARAVEAVVPEAHLELKWPNDLMLGERKAGGVLCEARWQGRELAWVAVGLGLNVTNPLPDDIVTTATTLNSVAPHLAIESLVEPITLALRALPVDRAGLTPEELAEFDRRDWLKNRTVVEPVPGVVLGIDAGGALRIRDRAGQTVEFRTGQVQLG